MLISQHGNVALALAVVPRASCTAARTRNSHRRLRRALLASPVTVAAPQREPAGCHRCLSCLCRLPWFHLRSQRPLRKQSNPTAALIVPRPSESGAVIGMPQEQRCFLPPHSPYSQHPVVFLTRFYVSGSTTSMRLRFRLPVRTMVLQVDTQRPVLCHRCVMLGSSLRH